MAGARELVYMVRDFVPTLVGRDYFHQAQGLGKHFQDERCYYNDLTGKAGWKGKYVHGVPALFLPAWKRYITLPVMVLQYGLGSIDQYLLSGDSLYHENIHRVTEWILSNLKPEGYFDNGAPDLDPGHHYISSNSAMAQGEALSFLIRVIQYRLGADHRASELGPVIGRIFRNMVAPVEERGTALWKSDDLYFLEFCRNDEYIVLNGWIFAIFGLLDYDHYSGDVLAGKCLHQTLRTLRKSLPGFVLPGGWSYYDNHQRICSPFYHNLHVGLFQALDLLTGEEDFRAFRHRLESAQTLRNRVRFVVLKIIEKLKDRQAYASRA